MKKRNIIIPIVTFILFATASCKKDTNSPGISISHPHYGQTFPIGSKIPVEGLAVDEEGLKEVRYRLETPEASYNYIIEGAIPVSGVNEVFKAQIQLSEEMSIGEGVISFYTVDQSDNVSEVIYQAIELEDDLEPVFTHYVDGEIDNLDSLTMTMFKNENDIFDSVVVYNITQDELIFTGTDMGGFTLINVHRNGPFDEGYTINFDLIPVEDEVYTVGHRAHLDPDYEGYHLHPPYLRLNFKEYDYSANVVDLKINE